MKVLVKRIQSEKVERAITLQDEIDYCIKLINNLVNDCDTSNLGKFLNEIDTFKLEDIANLISDVLDYRIELEKILDEMNENELKEFNNY